MVAFFYRVVSNKSADTKSKRDLVYIQRSANLITNFGSCEGLMDSLRVGVNKRRYPFLPGSR